MEKKTTTKTKKAEATKSTKTTKTTKTAKTTTKVAKAKDVEIRKRILFVASEAQPFCATGGLADVCGSLPKEVKKNDN